MNGLGCIGQSPEERIDAGWWGPAFFSQSVRFDVSYLCILEERSMKYGHFKADLQGFPTNFSN